MIILYVSGPPSFFQNSLEHHEHGRFEESTCVTWASESQTPGLKFLYPLTGYVISGPYVNLSVPPFPHL